jgi:type II secretory pathway pseudopilin PulG
MTPFSRKSGKLRRGEQGYVLLTMLLTVSLMTIAAMAVLPDMIFQLKRDQEQEMIHRGVQYTRAIRLYYRKLGRYPTSLTDLDNTSNLRFLRKHYKDPLTGKDFKLLHYGDPGLQLAGGFGSGTIAGATPAGAMNGPSGSALGNSNGSSFGNSSFGNSSFGSSSFGSSSGSGFSNSSFGGSSFGNNGVNSSGVFSQSSFGGNSNNSFGQNSNSQNSSTQGGDASSGAAPSGNVSSDGTAAPNGTASPGSVQGNGQDATDASQKVFGGGAIVGVASISKNKTIRIFNKKTKYNEWQFIYDPTADRGGLITTPYQTPLQNFGNQSLQPGQNGSQSGSSNSAFGNSSGSSFGQSSGFGQSSFGGSPSGGSSFGGSSFGQSSGFGNNNSNSSGSGSSSSSSQQQ